MSFHFVLLLLNRRNFQVIVGELVIPFIIFKWNIFHGKGIKEKAEMELFGIIWVQRKKVNWNILQQFQSFSLSYFSENKLRHSMLNKFPVQSYCVRIRKPRLKRIKIDDALLTKRLPKKKSTFTFLFAQKIQ